MPYQVCTSICSTALFGVLFISTHHISHAALMLILKRNRYCPKVVLLWVAIKGNPSICSAACSDNQQKMQKRVSINGSL